MSKPLTRERALEAIKQMQAAQGRVSGVEQAGGENEAEYVFATGNLYRSLAKASGVDYDDVVAAALEDRLSPIVKLAEQRSPRRTAIPTPLTSEQVRERMRRSNPEHVRDLERQRVQVDHLDRLQRLGPEVPTPPASRALNGRLFGAAAVVQLLARRQDPWMAGDAA